MDFTEIIAEYNYRTELHAHTNPVSGCGQLKSDEVIADYLTETRTDTLTVTNHLQVVQLENRTLTEAAEYFLSDYRKAVEAAKNTRLTVALGAEIRFKGTNNDYLVYGISEDDIEKMFALSSTDIHTFRREFSNGRTVIIQAHPFRNGMEPTPLDAVDGIETINSHPNHNSRILVACRFAREHDLLVTAGSDYHGDERRGVCLMRTKAPLHDSFDVADAIKSRDVIFELPGHIVLPYSG